MKDNIEIIEKRKTKEKHYLKKDGTMFVEMYAEDIHYLKDGIYEEIDNTLVFDGNSYRNKRNSFKVSFNDNDEELLYLEKKQYYFKMNLKNSKKKNFKYISNKEIGYDSVFNGVNLKYTVLSSKIKESIVLNNKDSIVKKIVFIIKTNLELELQKDKSVLAKDKNEIIFKIESPYMTDSNNIYNYNINYELNKKEKDYELSLILDENWLKEDNRKYPVIIDPTVTNSKSTTNVEDTYISSNNPNNNFNNQDILKTGIEKINNIDVEHRSLLKFELPEIGTGFDIIKAQVALTGLPVYYTEWYPPRRPLLDVYRITEAWQETTATWNNMNNKYDNSRIDGAATIMPSRYIYFPSYSQEFEGRYSYIDITDLVKKWYSGLDNFGIILKQHEPYRVDNEVTTAFSKNNTVQGDNPKPLLVIQYRNRNGLEDYMTCETQNFTNGSSNINHNTGNLTTVFNLINTIGGKLPAGISIIYNTNDVILNNNIGYGLGFKLNYHQTIEERTIEENIYLEYIDADGTIHYFDLERDWQGNITGDLYKDEDGLSLTITKETNTYLMNDKVGNSYLFRKNGNIYYLEEITDVSQKQIIITYNTVDAKYKITKVTDSDNSEINILYGGNTITFNTLSDTATLNYANNQVTSIVTKQGTTNFIYTNNRISKITDINGLSIGYDYHNVIPYRISKVTEYGINDSEGNHLTYDYAFSATTTVDNKGRIQTYSFNDYGNTISITSLESGEDIRDGYAKENIYGGYLLDATPFSINLSSILGMPNDINKLTQSFASNKPVKNYLSNSSFEESNIIFTADYPEIVMTLDNSQSRTGSKSLKIDSMESNTSISKQINVPKGNDYTFSCYFKNIIPTKISLSYIDENNQNVENISEEIKGNNIFNRYEVTIFYPQEATSQLKIKIYFENGNNVYIDDVQLECGKVANYHNLVENCDFSDGLTGWTISAHPTFVSLYDSGYNPTIDPDRLNDNVVTLPNGSNYLNMKSDPYLSKDIRKSFPINGKAGDTYNMSFWYKNLGKFVGDYIRYPRANIYFHYVPGSPGHGVKLGRTLNFDTNEWIYHEETFMALYDYDSIEMDIYNINNTNELQLTNFALFKDVENSGYNYDEHGNISSTYDPNNKLQQFNYDKNNQLIQMLDSKNNKLVFEYDNEITDRALKGISETGISTEITYDGFNNPIRTRINNLLPNNELKETEYYIRLKGTKKYLDVNLNNITLKENTCSHTKFTLIKSEDYYRIKPTVINEYYFTLFNNQIVLMKNTTDDSLFGLIKNKNGSYSIKPKNSDHYLTVNNNIITLNEFSENDSMQQFYFEDINKKLFIENKAAYTEDGKFITSTTDTLGNTVVYDINPNNGLTNSITDPGGNITYYTYNNKEQITNVARGNQEVEYQYNGNNLLSKIIYGSKEYSFAYDDFLNKKSVKIGNKTLITNEYQENNGNLLSSIYGNNDTVLYSYDEFDRIETINKMNDIYNITYNNLGKISKIKANNDSYNYYYDLSQRISSYQFNDFRINYDYDISSNVTDKHYELNDIYKHINYSYNKENTVDKITFDNNEINYIYDTLGRLKEKNINDILKTSYKYITNGNKTSFILKSLKNNNDEYRYIYDKLNNITHIYLNEELINKYKYDINNQLIEDNNFITNITTEYIYDNVGNITSKKDYELDTETLINENIYEYNNINWEDQLTKFNNEEITYDEIGNPLTIGTDINMSWTNGRELTTYEDNIENISISYKYNKDGIRTSKTINNIETEYYLENNNIIVEKGTEYVIYYIQDESNSLIGFTYENTNNSINNGTYYYIKNAQNDIIEIVDNENNKVAKYLYDAYGNHIYIKDGNGINVSNDLTHIANINPYRYRSYYYDREANLYYLNSRYYNPEWGRFINLDMGISLPGEIKGYNMYEYAFNNPINLDDSEGTWPKWLKVVATVTAVIVVAAVATVAFATTGGVASVIATGVLKGAATGAAIGAASGAIGGAVSHTISTGSVKDAGQAAIKGAVTGAVTGAAGGAVLGGISSAVQVGQAASAWSEGGTYNSGFSSMSNHYQRQVIEKGFSQGNNIIKYTNDALNFANRNQNVLQFAKPSRSTMLPGFTSSYSTGNPGGWFTSSGKILTFWYK